MKPDTALAPADPLSDVAEVRRAVDAGRLDAAAALCRALLSAKSPTSEALALMGEIAYKRGERETAAEWLEKAIAADKRHARAHWLLGNIYQDERKLDRAISSYRRALRAAPDLAEAHNDLGAAYYEKGWYAEAEQCYRQSLALRPDDLTSIENLGTALRAQGKLREARDSFLRLLKLRVRSGFARLFRRKPPEPAPRAPSSGENAHKRAIAEVKQLYGAEKFAEAETKLRGLIAAVPQDPDLHHLLGNVLAKKGSRAAAIEHLEQAIALRSSVPEFYVSLGTVLAEDRQLEKALECYQAALALDPGYAAAVANIGWVLHDLGLFREAEENYRLSLTQDPDDAAVHANLAGTLISLGKLAEAERAASKALALDAASVHSLVMLAGVRLEQGRPEEARELHRRAYEIRPNDASLLRSIAKYHLVHDGNVELATTYLERSKASSPEDPSTRLTLAQTLLLRNRFAEGWDEYEWRKRQLMRSRVYSKFPYPEWDGAALAGKAIVVNGEQGLGDEIMFASCFSELVSQATRVAIFCNRRLEALFRRSLERAEVYGGSHQANDDPFPALEGIDFQVAAGSLPKRFRRSLEEFPAHSGYLKADPGKTERWRERLQALGAGMKIGLSWKGGTPLSGRTRRTLTLDRLEPIIRLPGACWISLQYGDCESEIAAFAARTGTTIHHWREAVDDLDETAALMCALDLRISVCNTQVHLSGALGGEVWVLAPFVPDWRYGLEGGSMPWYPAARMFRQRAAGDWSAPLAGVADLLSRRLRSR